MDSLALQVRDPFDHLLEPGGDEAKGPGGGCARHPKGLGWLLSSKRCCFWLLLDRFRMLFEVFHDVFDGFLLSFAARWCLSGLMGAELSRSTRSLST